MSISQAKVSDFAQRLDHAARNTQAIPKLTGEQPDLSIPDAYDIQLAMRALRLGAGARLSGLKMGLTSQAKMQQMRVESPIYGFLLDEFCVPPDSVIPTRELIHPRIEPEIAVVTARDLRGPGCTIADVLTAIDFVLPAIEIIDSRYADFKFDLPSVVADNASSARYVAGTSARRLAGIDLRTLGVVVEKNGQGIAFGAGAAVLGHPALSVVMLANLLAERGEYIPAGTYVMTGGITEAIAAEAGDCFTVRIQHLGAVSVRFA
jgi:2-oxo-3-hexenedioate decarboxylase